MSMEDYPTSGYILPLEKYSEIVRKAFRPEVVEEYEDVVEFGDEDGILEWIEKHPLASLNFPTPSEVFALTDEDTPSENMEAGKFYLLFEESDLYYRVETKQLCAMEEAGVRPSFEHWAKWG